MSLSAVKHQEWSSTSGYGLASGCIGYECYFVIKARINIHDNCLARRKHTFWIKIPSANIVWTILTKQRVPAKWIYMYMEMMIYFLLHVSIMVKCWKLDQVKPHCLKAFQRYAIICFLATFVWSVQNCTCRLWLWRHHTPSQTTCQRSWRVSFPAASASLLMQGLLHWRLQQSWWTSWAQQTRWKMPWAVRFG